MNSVSTGVAAAALLASGACRGATPSYVAHDATLRSNPVFVYPARDPSAREPLVVFLGNDVGFWAAHDELARRFAGDNYPVVGVDVKRITDDFPADPSLRPRAFADRMRAIIAAARREFPHDSAALVLVGHSYGADLALWLAATAVPHGLIGVVALGPTERGHFEVTLADRLNRSEPREAGSFAVADEIRAVPGPVRIALLRGDGDARRRFDSTLRAAGGARLDYTVIPFAGHSLRSLTIAGPMIEHALAWVSAARAAPR